MSNQPSNSSELELFKQLNLLSRIDNVKRLFESVSDTVESVRNALTTALKNNKNTTNSKITNNIINRSRNESVKKHSINGHRHIPLHRLMHKDEIKLFLNDLYNEEINSRSTESHLAYHSRHQNDTSINQKITSGNSDVDPNSSPIKSADEGRVYKFFFNTFKNLLISLLIYGVSRLLLGALVHLRFLGHIRFLVFNFSPTKVTCISCEQHIFVY